MLAHTSSLGQWVARTRVVLAPRRAGACTDDELRRNGQARRRAPATLDLLDQEVEAAPPDLEEILPHRRQRWREERRLGHVVEADDAHVAGDRAACFVEGAE